MHRYEALPVLAGLTASAAGCGDERSGEAGRQGPAARGGESPHIIMVTHGVPRDPFWNALKRGSEDAARDFDVKFDYQATQKVDPAEQARLIEAALARNPDGLAVSILDPGHNG